MDLQLKGKRALVLASSKGLGRAIAAGLIAEGAEVAIQGRDKDALEKVRKEMGAKAAVVGDLSQPGVGREMVDQAADALGRIDILVTNAGGPPAGSFEAVSSEQWLAGFQQLWMGMVDATQAVLPGMRARKFGRILLVTSSAAKEPVANLTISNGLRAGLLGLAKSLSREVAADGVTVNAILPGKILTDRIRELYADLDAAAKEVPAKRIGDPAELAALAAFLASEKAAYITGQAIAVDGGLLHGV